MRISETSTLIANMPKSFILSRFKLACALWPTHSIHIWVIFYFRPIWRGMMFQIGLGVY